MDTEERQSENGNQNEMPPKDTKTGKVTDGRIGFVIFCMVLLFFVWGVSAFAINGLHRQVEALTETLEGMELSLSDAHAKADELRYALENKADREELQAARFLNVSLPVKSVAHRGLSAEAPENTIPAFALAWSRGFSFVETDIRFTADGCPVCLHDGELDRTSNGTGLLCNLTLAQVKQLDFGAWMGAEYTGTQIPTFEEFLSLCRGLGLHPYIELKEGRLDQIQNLVEMVRRFGLNDQVTWISFSSDLLSYVSRFDRTARLGLLVGSVTPETILAARLLRTERNSVFLDSCSDTREECRRWEENGIPLEIWTINSAETVITMDTYISGVTSDNLIAGQVLLEAAQKSLSQPRS